MEVTVMVGAGVANINAATKLIDNGYEGKIKIIDMGKNPHDRLPEEVMTGMLGAGGWSDGILTYHTGVGGQLSKYCGEEKAMVRSSSRTRFYKTTLWFKIISCMARWYRLFT